MVSALGHHLNKIVFVSIPSIFDDLEARACTLTGIEVSGLWLGSPDLVRILLHPDDKQASPSIFVPFAQIAYLLESGPIDRTPSPVRQKEVSTNPEKRTTTTTAKKKRRVT
jgi:hypothetical protein